MIQIDKLNYLQIGVQGENEATSIEIDVSAWAEQFPDAYFHILFKAYNASESVPVLTTYENGVLTWIVSAGDTAVVGVGYAEIRAQEADTGMIKKSRIIPAVVEHSVSGVETEPPEAWQAWVTSVLNAAEVSYTIKGQVQQIKDDTLAAKQAAEAARDAAQAAAGDFQGITAEAEALATGSEATVEVTHSEGGLYNFAFGLPRGIQGPQGDPAPQATVAAAVTEWMDENITEDPTVVIDTSLSVEGAAADAKAAGNEISSVKNALTDITGNAEITNWSENKKYIKLNQASVDINSPTTTTSNVHYSIVQASEGDKFTVTSTGGDASRAWGFVASDGTILATATANETVVKKLLIAPKNTAYLVINDTSLTGKSYYGEFIAQKNSAEIEEMRRVVSAIDNSVPLNVPVISGTGIINYSTGEVADSSLSCRVSDYIDISDYITITYKRCTFSNSSSSGIAFYNGSKTYISGVRSHGASGLSRGYEDATCAVPDGAKYVRFTLQRETDGEFSATGTPRLYDIAQRVAECEVITNLENKFSNWTDPDVGTYASPSAPTSEYTSVVKRTATGSQYAWMYCNAGDKFVITGKGGNYIRAYIFADASGKTYPSDISWCGAANTNYTDHEIIAPVGAVCVYVSRDYSESVHDSYKNETIKEYAESLNKPINKNLIVVNMGDSIFGNFRLTSGPNESISHMIENVTQMTCLNHAFGGTHAKYRGGTGKGVMDFESLATAIATGDFTAQIAYAQTLDNAAYVQRVEDLRDTNFSEVNIVTVAFGTNDWSSGVTPDAFGDAVANGIDTIAAVYPNLRFLICTPIIRFKRSDDPIYDAETEESTGESTTIIDSDNNGMVNSGGYKLSAYAQKMEDIGKTLHMPVCENYWTLGINLSNHETFMKDFVHPNVLGRKLIAHHMIDMLNRM